MTRKPFNKCLRMGMQEKVPLRRAWALVVAVARFLSAMSLVATRA